MVIIGIQWSYLNPLNSLDKSKKLSDKNHVKMNENYDIMNQRYKVINLKLSMRQSGESRTFNQSLQSNEPKKQEHCLTGLNAKGGLHARSE